MPYYHLVIIEYLKSILDEMHNELKGTTCSCMIQQIQNGIKQRNFLRKYMHEILKYNE